MVLIIFHLSSSSCVVQSSRKFIVTVLSDLVLYIIFLESHPLSNIGASACSICAPAGFGFQVKTKVKAAHTTGIARFVHT
jgi:hypothetical protein